MVNLHSYNNFAYQTVVATSG